MAAAAAMVLLPSSLSPVSSAPELPRLIGLNLSGLEYACVEGWGLADTPTGRVTKRQMDAITGWSSKVNTARLPVAETCWLGKAGARAGVPKAYRGPRYRKHVDHIVNYLTGKGIRVIVDLHRTAPGRALALKQDPAPNAAHSRAFWRSVANRYKGNPLVLFGLFNEPYGIGWKCWLNGGCHPVSANSGKRFTAVGVNDLIATVRKTGARNWVVVGGIDWAERARGILNHRPNDPAGRVIVDVHIYDFNTIDMPREYNREYAPVAKQYPMLIGETGPGLAPDTPFGGGPPSYIRGNGFIKRTLGWADRHGVGYTAWAANPWGDCWALFRDWSGKPTPKWGKRYINHVRTSA